MTTEGVTSRSRGAEAPESCEASRPNGGRRESRVLAAPIASRAELKKHTSAVTTGSPKQSGLPCAMVYGLFRALPGDRALLPPSPRRSLRNLTPASGRQDHTTSPSAGNIAGLARYRVHRIPHPTFVTIAKRPSCGQRNGGKMRTISDFQK